VRVFHDVAGNDLEAWAFQLTRNTRRAAKRIDRGIARDAALVQDSSYEVQQLGLVADVPPHVLRGSGGGEGNAFLFSHEQ
jgi:hypothetical protein